MKKTGVIYNHKLSAARILGEQLLQRLHQLGTTSWLYSVLEEEDAIKQMKDTELVFSIGGDGTILRAARSTALWGVPIVGINLGSMGFLTELNAAEALEKAPLFLSGGGWIDERAMIQAELSSANKPGENEPPYHALNDVVVGRGAVPRLIHIKASIDGEPVTIYRTDGVIISTATGSTAYSLASGGPILYPRAKEILLLPVSTHLGMSHTLVLPPTATIELQIQPGYQAVLSIDGQINLALQEGATVKVKHSSYMTRLLRIGSPASFYSSLEQKLREKRAG